MAPKKQETNNAQIEAIEHTDVRGKKQFYLKISVAGKEDYLMNIGIKSYETIQSMTKPIGDDIYTTKE